MSAVEHQTTLSAIATSTVVLTFLFAGCVKQQQGSTPQPQANAQTSATLDKPPDIMSESGPDEYFHDLVFYVQEHERLADGTQIIRASGVHKDKPVAFEVALGPTWKAGSVSKDIALVTYQGTVTYRSVGSESDRFVQVLDGLYDVKLSPKAMRKETVFDAISLKGDPRDLSKGEVKIKLFYSSNDADRYAELFTNVDLASRRLYFNEKDADYRAPVVRALRAD